MKLVLSLLIVLVLVVGVSQASAFTLDNAMILDEKGVSIEKIDVNTQVKFQAKLTNNNDTIQPYIFSRIINDENGNLIADDFTSSALKVGKTIIMEMSWMPENSGNYEIILQVFNHEGNSLTEPSFLTLMVEGSTVPDTELETLRNENAELRQEIIRLNGIIEELQEQVVSLVKEFSIFTVNLNDWFQEQLKN